MTVSDTPVFQIRIQGQIDASWSDWLGGLAITSNPDGETLLAGPIADQAALHGVLLDGGQDGLDVYRRLLASGREWLRPGGVLGVELDERRVSDAAEEARQWYEDVSVVLDLTGRDRIVTARLARRP